MRRGPLLLLLAAAVAAVGWFLLTYEGRAPTAVRTPDETTASGEPGAGLVTPSRTSTEPRKGPAPRAPASAAPGSARYETGSLVVWLRPQGDFVVPKEARVDLEAIGVSPPPGVVPDLREDGSRFFDSVVAGRYRVRAMVEGAEDASALVTVSKDQEAQVEIPLVAGGTVRYDVSLLSGEAPDTVRLALLDGQRVAIAMTVQTAATTVRVPADRQPLLPPEGKVIGLAPGSYSLRATSAAGETVERGFDIGRGESAAVQLTLRR
jgi:hypothetical protein